MEACPPLDQNRKGLSTLLHGVTALRQLADRGVVDGGYSAGFDLRFDLHRRPPLADRGVVVGGYSAGLDLRFDSHWMFLSRGQRTRSTWK
jgi:hypothetical protein